jgi:hypothetical protein
LVVPESGVGFRLERGWYVLLLYAHGVEATEARVSFCCYVVLASWSISNMTSSLGHCPNLLPAFEETKRGRTTSQYTHISLASSTDLSACPIAAFRASPVSSEICSSFWFRSAWTSSTVHVSFEHRKKLQSTRFDGSNVLSSAS